VTVLVGAVILRLVLAFSADGHVLRQPTANRPVGQNKVGSGSVCVAAVAGSDVSSAAVAVSARRTASPEWSVSREPSGSGSRVSSLPDKILDYPAAGIDAYFNDCRFSVRG
jgi:hypothetical protein